MKVLSNILPLRICLLLLAFTVKANSPEQSSVELLNTNGSPEIMEDGQELGLAISAIPVSTLINTGIWWAYVREAL